MNRSLYHTKAMLLFFFILSIAASHPQNPCPELFQYQYDGSQWFGLIQLRNILVGQTINLSVNLSLGALLTSRYVGMLELLEGRQKTIQTVVNGKPVLYKIVFPLQNPLPSVVEIIVNNQILCRGSPEVGPQTTRIHLEHTFYTTVLDRFGASMPNPFLEGNGNVFGNNFNQFSQNLSDGLNAFTDRLNTQQLGNDFTNYLLNNGNNNRPNSGFLNINNGDNNQPPLFSTDNSNSQNNIPSFGMANTGTGSGGLNFWSPNDFGQAISPTLSNPPKKSNNICGQVDPKFNIKRLVVGGEKIQRGAWPWLTAIYMSEPGPLQHQGPFNYKCGGNLLSSTVTITAAHCFRFQGTVYSAANTLISLGIYNVNNRNEPGSITMGSSDVHVHPDYEDKSSTFDADIALVILQTSVSFTDYIRPVCLWSGSLPVSDIEGSSGTVVGWGRDEFGNPYTAEPNKVDVTVYTDKTCVQSNEMFRPITSKRTFCAGLRNGKGPCTGDSGSGLMIFRNNRWELRGTVAGSLGDPMTNTCNLNEFVVYADIMQFRDWINTYM